MLKSFIVALYVNFQVLLNKKISPQQIVTAKTLRAARWLGVPCETQAGHLRPQNASTNIFPHRHLHLPFCQFDRLSSAIISFCQFHWFILDSQMNMKESCQAHTAEYHLGADPLPSGL